MTSIFRNVEVDPASDPDEWPFEAVLAAIERGALSDWRRLAAAIRAQPWGPCARAVETIVSWGENGGLDPLFTSLIAESRDGADAAARREYGARLRAIREELGMSLREFAPHVGTSAQRLSSYESGRVAPSIVMLARVDRAHARLGRRASVPPRGDDDAGTRAP